MLNCHPMRIINAVPNRKKVVESNRLLRPLTQQHHLIQIFFLLGGRGERERAGERGIIGEKQDNRYLLQLRKF